MKSQFPTRFGISVAVLGGVVLGLCTMAFRAQADVWNKKTVLTVDQPIQIQDTYLEPGTYVFKLLDSSSNRNIVQIYNSDENHLINTIMAIPNYRLQPTGNTRFTFYETPPGTARAMHAWFYPGDNFGQEFRYPKQLHQLVAVAQVTPAPVVTRPPEPPPPPVVTQPAQPEPAPQQAAVPEQKQEEPVVIAQNNPPPAPAAAPEPQPQPTQLPQTATPYPFLGLLGLISLAGYALLRVKSMT
jgi:outer membrane biosynthesis protein TonB